MKFNNRSLGQKKRKAKNDVANIIFKLLIWILFFWILIPYYIVKRIFKKR